MNDDLEKRTFHFNITKFDENDYVVRFKDIPEAITGARTYTEAFDLANDCLVTCSVLYQAINKELPITESCESFPLETSIFVRKKI